MRPHAAIDIGSNAIRLAIGELTRDGQLNLVHDSREALRLGQDSFSSGVISDFSMMRLIETFDQFKKILSDFGVEHLRAVGTSALREATNQREVVRTLRERTGIKIELIRGEEEAELIHLAVSERIELQDKLALLIDIGGGSVEVTLVDRGNIVRSESAPMGTVRLLKILEQKKNPGRVLNRLIREYSTGIRQQIAQELNNRSLDLAVGTGGNIDCLGELRKRMLGKDDSGIITKAELEKIVEKLQASSIEDRASELQLRPDRADVIFPAAAVLLAVLNQAKIEELRIPHVGLKEGVLLEMLNDSAAKKKKNRKQQLLHFARELGKKYDYHQEHAQAVSRLSLMLFDQLKPLHDLDDEYRTLLEIGALLHDIGQFVSYNGHHKHSAYLIMACSFVGLNEREQAFVAALTRYHRKAAPKADHPEFARLQEKDRQPLLALAGILRVADALDREHASLVKDVTLEWNDAEIRVELKGQGELLLERWAVEKKGKLFEEFFKRELFIKE